MNTFGSLSLSAGRVQSVLTRFICDRDREIENFIPEDFWTINVSLYKDEDVFSTKYYGRITDLQSAEDIKAKLNTDEYIVSEVISAEEKVQASPPLITSTLQRMMSKKYGISADQSMLAAQALYEKGIITYLRTDSVRASDESIEEARKYLTDNSFSIPKKANKYENKDRSQDAHEAIRPTDITLHPKDTSFSNQTETKVYQVIWECFLASQCSPAVYNTLKVTAHPSNDKTLQVKTSGKALKSPGFLSILGIKDKSEINIPMLNKGDRVYLCQDGILCQKKQIQPPPKYSEDKLIKQLEDKGVGRPATYADLITKITTRGYVSKEGNIFSATELGKKVTDILTANFSFLDYNYTAEMENKLDDIANGKMEHIKMLKDFYEPFKEEINKAYISNGSELCEKCKSPMIIRKNKKTGETFLGCSNYPSCFSIKQIEKVEEKIAAE